VFTSNKEEGEQAPEPRFLYKFPNEDLSTVDNWGLDSLDCSSGIPATIHYRHMKRFSICFMKNFVNHDIIDACRNSIVNLPGFQPIFLKTDETMDENRLMVKLKKNVGKELKSVMQKMLEFARHIHKEWRPQKFVAIKSLPNGSDQELHQDYPFEELYRDLKETGIYPGGMLLALQDNTYFNCVPSEHLSVTYNTEDAVKLTLMKGDAVLFYGNLIHGGAGYDEENLRVHCYFLQPNRKYKENITARVVELKTFFCQKCSKFFQDQDSLSAHIQEHVALDS
jgi:hypothetical protein